MTIEQTLKDDAAQRGRIAARTPDALEKMRQSKKEKEQT